MKKSEKEKAKAKAKNKHNPKVRKVIKVYPKIIPIRGITSELLFKEKVISFLYELGRDYLPLGDIETLTRNSEQDIITDYENKELEIYARKIAKRLDNKKAKDWQVR